MLARQYEGVPFDVVHHAVLRWLPVVSSTVIDIGAGTGRDAAALAARGYRVVAVEPTAELREIGQRLHSDANIEWLDDALPDLSRVRGTFDLILLSAVWMHLDASERAAGMARISRLLASETQVIMSLRHGPVPPGRRMFAVSAAETVALAGQWGLRAVHCDETTDLQGRAGVRWSTLVLHREAGAQTGAAL